MKRYLKSAVYATALLLGSVSTDAVMSAASAQTDISVSFDSFHNQLASYGDWVYSDRWGEVWIPGDVPADFHPYGTAGRWVYTDEYGWTWESDYEWGDIPFHYGRWVNDPYDGWLWIPGYVWSPGWVVWRHNSRYTGWMPMPPDDRFLGRGPSTSIGISIGGLSVSFNSTEDDYGYSRWYGRDYGRDRFASNWIFIGTGHIADRDYRRYEAPRNDYRTIIHNTTNITNYTVVNNYVVNRSIDPNVVRKAGGHVQPVKIADVVKRPQFITRADTGSQLQARMRAERPHGTGLANSAPKPTPIQIQSLSTKVPRAQAGKPSAHLFTRDTVTKARLSPRPAGTTPLPSPVGAPGATPNATPTNAMTPMERKNIRRGVVPTTETPAGKPVVTGPAMERHGPGPTVIRGGTPPVKALQEKKLPGATTAPGTAPAETLREKKVRERVNAPAGTSKPAETLQERTKPLTETNPPAEIPRTHVRKPATELAPAGPAETPRALPHMPVTETPAMRAHPVVPVRPVVERPKRPVPTEAHVPQAPKEKKKTPPEKPEHEKPVKEH